MLPVRDIVLHATCELRSALLEARDAHPSFLAHPWAISISVTPKIDTELTLRAGLTGKSTSASPAPYFNSWILGAAPGAEYDMRGHTDGGVSYSMQSSQLLDPVKYPLKCDQTSEKYHALASQLGLYDWLSRTAAASEGSINKLTRVVNPTYNSQVIAQWDGSGSFTYNFPFGTDFAGLYASYKLDESVAIAFTAEPVPPPRKVKTLPGLTGYTSAPVVSDGNVSQDAQDRLNLLHLQQTIMNLDTTIRQRR